MFHSNSILVVLLLSISQIALGGTVHAARANHEGAAVKHQTNAARMAAGLTPLPPVQLKKRTWGWGSGGWGGQPSWGQPHGGQPSWGGDKGKDDKDKGKDKDKDKGKPTTPTYPTPPKPSQPPTNPDREDKKDCKIKCKRKGGKEIGYVSKDWSKKGKRGFGMCYNKNDALKLDFEKDSNSNPFDFKIKNGKENYGFLGFTGNNLNSWSSAVLTGTKKTSRGNAPSNVGNAFSSWSANSESQIWYKNRSSKHLESKWINQGGQTLQTTVCYEPGEDLFHLVADVKQFQRRYPGSFEVEFEIED